MNNPWHILIDTGGTFTDCIALDPTSRLHRLKVLSSSSLRGLITKKVGDQYHFEESWGLDNPKLTGYHIYSLDGAHSGIVDHFNYKEKSLTINGERNWEDEQFEIRSTEEVPVFATRLLTGTGIEEPLPDVDLRLGSTRGTNALLERKVAPTALIVNQGFQDILEIGNQQRPDIFSLAIQKQSPLYVKTYEISGRLDASGNAIESIKPEQVEAIAQDLKNRDISCAAIALINSYRNPDHEGQVERILRGKGIRYVSASSHLSEAIKYLPRAQTAVVNACLSPVIGGYLSNITTGLNSRSQFNVISSSGGLAVANEFEPKDSLLSGPAGGILGAVRISKLAGFESILTLDMGGTSADVAHYRNQLDYTYENTVGDATILSPALAIHTVAAGGGSICGFDGLVMTVGPESAGADPGPACYGKGGPLTLTDISLLAGRIDASSFQIPIDFKAAEKALENIILIIGEATGNHPSRDETMDGYLRIASEKMSDAIREVSVKKGHDPSEYVFFVFGGAGGQYACDIADNLGMKKILLPYDAGLLSAYGIGSADLERFSELQVLQPLTTFLSGRKKTEGTILMDLRSKIIEQFGTMSIKPEQVQYRRPLYYLRYAGQESTIEIATQDPEELDLKFAQEYQRLVGHTLDRPVELESIKLTGYVPGKLNIYSEEKLSSYIPAPYRIDPVPHYDWSQMDPGAEIPGPAVIVNTTSTVFLKAGWRAELDGFRNFRLNRLTPQRNAENTSREEVLLELYTNRFTGIASLMGAILERTSFSVNIKERLDFSCAILDGNGQLIINAPHIPVHLGSMGVCVREVLKTLQLKEGDVAITNHPAFGGSHLPDITLIAPVIYKGEKIAYVANRAHHAEIGGIQPGSMPTNAANLAEEGVVISPQLLAENGEVQWERITELLSNSQYPSRNVAENIADLTGALASIKAGVEGIVDLCDSYGSTRVRSFLSKISDRAARKASQSIAALPDSEVTAQELLDDGRALNVKITISGHNIHFDFTGTAESAPGNMNATPAIVNSTILYVLRLLINESIPLNEGMMETVKVTLPHSLLNPPFSKNPADDPAVVGGNTEVSQRLTDLLLKALGMAACSQGTMNNLVFGNDRFGFYETICGGTGASKDHHGASAVHQHMTNTRITDPEIMEHRYPVSVQQFSIRKGSGGDGRWSGGDGICRSIRFMEPVTLNLLSQHRIQKPYGLAGGQEGMCGDQFITRKDGTVEKVAGVCSCQLYPGDTFTILTPGGGGYGS